MAKAARARTGKPRARPAPPALSSESTGWSPHSIVFVGLCAVVMAVPLQVLGTAAGPYDDPKAWALPILVMATALAWLVRGPTGWSVEAGFARDRPLRVLHWTAAGYAGWWAITTMTSIAPGQSLLGSFGRGMGFLTVACAVLFFFLVQSECRGPDAVRALIDAVMLGSAPVCALALGQLLGWDPLPRAWDPATVELRARSTLGQHIFLGSYLAIVIPLTASRLWSLTHQQGRLDDADVTRGTPRGPLLAGVWTAGTLGIVALASHWPSLGWVLLPWGVLGAGTWTTLATPPGWDAGGRSLAVTTVRALLGLQAIVLVVSGARGPLLGLLFGLSITGLGMFARRRAFKAMAVSAAVVGGIILVLVLLNLTRSLAAPLEKLPGLHRLSDLGNLSYGSPGWFRLQVWSGIVSGWGRQLLGQEVIPGTSPWARDALGYGLETQLLTLDRLALPSLGYLEALGREWRGSYLVDRAHNVLLDHLVTGGLIGVMWWIGLVASLLLVGVSRLRSARTGEETSVRLGCLAAVLAHIAEAQVGIVTIAPLALFWMTGAVLASPSWAHASARSTGGVVGASRPPRSWWPLTIVAGGLAAALAVSLDTRWLLASIAYAQGARGYMAGRAAEAHADFRRSMDLAPWHALPAEAFASTTLKLAGGETDSLRRLDLLHDGESALARARSHAFASAASWTLTAQLTFAEARAGERGKLPLSLEAFEAAARLRPQDADLLAQWGWAWLEGGDARRAREAAERAVAVSGGRPGWLAWAVLARAARESGDGEKADAAADMAMRAAPPEARHLLKAFIP